MIDLGGGTLDVSLLNRQGGIFLTAAIAGNSYLGGQDFTHRLMTHIMTQSNLTADSISEDKPQQSSSTVLLNSDPDKPVGASSATQQLTAIDQTTLQKIRLLADQVKIDLTTASHVQVQMQEPIKVNLNITREIFNEINADLFQKVLRPIEVVLEEVSLSRDDVDEIVLVGGSTRVPKVREVIGEFFGRDLSSPPKVDPELAVATGVSVQAGILGGMWPLQVSAVEIPMKVRKIHVL